MSHLEQVPKTLTGLKKETRIILKVLMDRGKEVIERASDGERKGTTRLYPSLFLILGINTRLATTMPFSTVHIPHVQARSLDKSEW